VQETRNRVIFNKGATIIFTAFQTEFSVH